MLKEYIENKLEKLQGKTGVYYKNLKTQEELLIAENDLFLSASVIKLWVMGEAFHQIEQGILSKDTMIILKDSDKVPSGLVEDYARQARTGSLSEDMFPESGVLNLLHTGTELTIEDLYRLMITVSDNTATNILIDILGMEKINAFISSLGMEKTKLNRILFDTSPQGKNLENVISLKETGMFFEKIYKGELISRQASEEMSAILQNQQFNYKIPFFLPRIPIGHKTGEDNGITNDAGIIYSEIPFVLCFASNDTEVCFADRVCQEIAKKAYDYTIC
ncbi:serine hydrolase [Sinanaerobacter sp. ZZT-01]|uniref:serine hydrolase n=1 Tax=Sinanaerobacter sp. ZZT-01 TaxID=3111540 RepID=UPI002D79166E|nr:serine hydrolase [Sinanaerobacter sp. ZZT-01]WRR94849.1 serine hydrolase [Sinanaerobacter sp. ZZT-01]